jgi:2-polyprenyl-3-methyl-5-hydroxy-6-metoxy-1,4-benzoquinol methylase
MDTCWCGSKSINDFSEWYGICAECSTLVSKIDFSEDLYKVTDSDDDFYGSQYWLKHVTEEYGLEDIETRAKNDLKDRCVYRLPKGRSLDVGCGNGALVFLLGKAGYEAEGTELSPWICEHNKKTFGIKMHCGTLDNLSLPENSYGFISAIDVFEHLTEPIPFLKDISRILEKDGVLSLQLPCYPMKSYEEMVSENHPFLQMMKEKEHIYLYSKESIEKILKDEGYNYIYFENAIFDYYDMYLFASREETAFNEPETIVEALTGSPDQRLVLAVMQLHNQLTSVTADLEFVSSHANIRLQHVNMLNETATNLQNELSIAQESASDSPRQGETIFSGISSILQAAGIQIKNDYPPFSPEGIYSEQLMYFYNRLTDMLALVSSAVEQFSAQTSQMENDLNDQLRQKSENINDLEKNLADTEALSELRLNENNELKLRIQNIQNNFIIRQLLKLYKL